MFGTMRRLDAASVNDVGNALPSLFPLRRINFVVSELDRVPDRAGRIAPVGIAELLLALVALTAPP
jgi:hypothetical protein